MLNYIIFMLKWVYFMCRYVEDEIRTKVEILCVSYMLQEWFVIIWWREILWCIIVQCLKTNQKKTKEQIEKKKGIIDEEGINEKEERQRNENENWLGTKSKM